MHLDTHRTTTRHWQGHAQQIIPQNLTSRIVAYRRWIVTRRQTMCSVLVGPDLARVDERLHNGRVL